MLILIISEIPIVSGESPIPIPRGDSPEIHFPLPVPNSRGDYVGRGHFYWEVVEGNSKGISGHLPYNLPMYWFDPRTAQNLEDISKTPVIRRFLPGTLLKANGDPAGFTLATDDAGQVWLKVDLGGADPEMGGAICFVRANSKYIRPLNRTFPFGKLAFQAAVINDADGYTNVRSEPSTSGGIVTRIRDKERFLVLRNDISWSLVFSPCGKTGYMHNSRIKLLGNGYYGVARVADPDGYLNIRKGPSTSYDKISQVATGDLVYLQVPEIRFREVVGAWTRITTTSGVTGYVSKLRLRWVPITGGNTR